MSNFTKINIRISLLDKVKKEAARQNLSVTKFVELLLIKRLK